MSDSTFDETNAIRYIRNHMPADIAAKYSDDELLNIIDMIWDYYEDNGFLEITVDDEEEPDIDQLMAYVGKMLAKDKLAAVSADDVHWIVEGELAYESTLDQLP